MAIISEEMLAKMLMSAVLWTVGDVIAQKIEQRHSRALFDYFRSLRILLWGALIFTPIVSSWFEYLQHRFPEEGFSGAVPRMLLDQLLMAPCMLALFFFYTAVTHGRGVDAGLDKVRNNLFSTLKVNWTVWPAVQLINFSVTPLEHRLLVTNLVSIPWAAYLAYRAGPTGDAAAQTSAGGTHAHSSAPTATYAKLPTSSSSKGTVARLDEEDEPDERSTLV